MLRRLASHSVLAMIIPAFAAAQAPTQKSGDAQGPPKTAQSGAPAQPAVERLGPALYRIGTIRVDTSARELSVPGTVNPDVRTLEFIANARDALRAYETAVTLDTDAITFNAALLLLGIDRTRTRNAPKAHFDPAVPVGDPVEVWIECAERDCGRIPANRLMYDDEAKQPVNGGTWVYTGSTFLPDGRYLAQVDGALIGFVHDPASIIEYAPGAGLNRYGSIILNPNLKLSAGTAITLTVKAVRPPGSDPKQ